MGGEEGHKQGGPATQQHNCFAVLPLLSTVPPSSRHQPSNSAAPPTTRPPRPHRGPVRLVKGGQPLLPECLRHAVHQAAVRRVPHLRAGGARHGTCRLGHFPGQLYTCCTAGRTALPPAHATRLVRTLASHLHLPNEKWNASAARVTNRGFHCCPPACAASPRPMGSCTRRSLLLPWRLRRSKGPAAGWGQPRQAHGRTACHSHHSRPRSRHKAWQMALRRCPHAPAAACASGWCPSLLPPYSCLAAS